MGEGGGDEMGEGMRMRWGRGGGGERMRWGRGGGGEANGGGEEEVGRGER